VVLSFSSISFTSVSDPDRPDASSPDVTAARARFVPILDQLSTEPAGTRAGERKVTAGSAAGPGWANPPARQVRRLYARRVGGEREQNWHPACVLLPVQSRETAGRGTPSVDVQCLPPPADRNTQMLESGKQQLSPATNEYLLSWLRGCASSVRAWW